MWGTESYSDGYEVGSKRQRAVDSTNPYFPMGAPGYLLPYNVNYTAAAAGSVSGVFPAVRLRGLPFSCTEADIFKFFAGLDIVDCLLTHKNGRFSGEAYVVFASAMQAEVALDRDQENMGRRYVEVFLCRKQEYYEAVAGEVNAGGATEFNGGGKEQLEYTEVLRLRGLPFSVTKREIVNFFRDFDVTEENVQVVVGADRKATGEAFVEFFSSEEAKGAMVKDRKTIGHRYIELFPSTPDEARRAKDRSRS